MILDETYTLANGVKIPKLGFGTWMIADDQIAQVAKNAVDAGYRHFDTAQAYRNERGLGEGLRACGLIRGELFVTTKLAAESKSFADASTRIEGSLEALGLDYIDLMIIHSPQPWAQFRKGEHFLEGNLEAWRALEEAHEAGKIRAIGVSNFERLDLDNILDNGSVPPVVNQVLAHVGNTPFDLIDYGQSRGILTEAYSPVAHGKIFEKTGLSSLAEKYGVSVAQLCIRYCLQLGTLPLPRTGNPEHMRQNASVDFEISEDDMSQLKGEGALENYGDASAFPVFGAPRRI